MSFSMPSEVMYGHIPVSTKTPLGKLLYENERKPGYDPKQNPYPKMLYKAGKRDDGTVRCMESHPKPFFFVNPEQYRMACEAVDNWNLSCQLTVGIDGKGKPAPEAGPAQQRAAEAEGWRESQAEAIAHVEAMEMELAREASRAAFRNKNMSDRAKAEWQAAEDETPHIIADIPIKPTQKKVHWKTAKKLAEQSAKVTV